MTNQLRIGNSNVSLSYPWGRKGGRKWHAAYKLYALMRNPRSCVGEISDRYKGSVDWSMPTPMPEKSFATSQCCQWVAKVSMKTL
jgi:hypothetical protein